MKPQLQDDDISQYLSIMERLQRLEQALGPESIHVTGTAGEPVFQNSWANYAGWQPAGFYRTNGRVYLQGLVTNTAGSPTSIIFTLPVGYRPANHTVFVVATGEPFAAGRVDVHSTGEVRWIAGAVTETDYTSLDGIHFRHV